MPQTMTAREPENVSDTKPGFESQEPVPEQAQDPTHEDIQQRAYQLWQTRLHHDMEGTADRDWLAAEQELQDQSQIRREKLPSEDRAVYDAPIEWTALQR